ncbi:hypothetical protein QWZ08_24335 [Ferruginibacter paludis]|uniref:hypothetical protein n=1 Tax=Ferruginibacter paludis TaxID=1310417 RepID=UPI0025B38FA4|nr:hypothetical protein [Ferruginibacter paludis]MDN3658794.1 hypothetical protein [Ferruginibacter paludis]
MMNLVLFGIFVFLLVAIQFAGGQTIDEIIEKHIRAKGGLNKMEDIREMCMKGEMTFTGIAIRLQITKQRDELNPSGFNMQWQTANDEGLTWENTLKGTMQIDNLMTEMQTTPDISQYLVNYAGKGYSVVLIGKEIVGDNSCYHVKLTTKDQQEIHYWINTSGFMLQQSCLIKEAVSSGDTGNYLTYYNYKPVDGIQIAHSIHVSKKGSNENSHCEIQFEKILINQPFEPFIVKPPIQS